MADFEARRREMVERQIASRGVRDRRVLDALRTVPREAFAPERLREFAYDDTALPIEEEPRRSSGPRGPWNWC
jgi:protein-L-isoaspartate O-methyltransferase